MSWHIFKYRAGKKVDELLELILDKMNDEEEENPEENLARYLKNRRRLNERPIVCRDAYSDGSYTGNSSTCISTANWKCKRN